MAGVEVHVPFRPATQWVDAMQTPSAALFHLTDAEGRKGIVRALVTVPGAREALEHQSHALITQATGRARWWEAVRLVMTSIEPNVLGRLVLAGVDPETRTIGEWCAAMYAVATQNVDETGRIRFDMALAFPPDGFEDEWDDGEDYEAMVAGFRDLPGVG